jgi:hypothetical protein
VELGSDAKIIEVNPGTEIGAMLGEFMSSDAWSVS